MNKATLDQAAKILEVFKGTPSEQIQAILGSGLLADLCDGNIEETDRDEFRRTLGLGPYLIKFESVIPLLGNGEEFIPRNHFLGKDWLSLNKGFDFSFLDKMEPSPRITKDISFGILLKNSKDKLILKKLKGETAEIELAFLFYLLQLQENGEIGFLLTDGRNNIFYVKNVFGHLLPVSVYRWTSATPSCKTRWNVDAYYKRDIVEWPEGSRVFSGSSKI